MGGGWSVCRTSHECLICFKPPHPYRHGEESDAWLVIYGRVYDVTDFLNVHPGGLDTLLLMVCQCTLLLPHTHTHTPQAACDASPDWDAVGHTSQTTKDHMKRMLIGKVVGPKPVRRRANAQKPSVYVPFPSISSSSSPSLTPFSTALRRHREPMSQGSGQSFNQTLALVVVLLAFLGYYLFGQ